MGKLSTLLVPAVIMLGNERDSVTLSHCDLSCSSLSELSCSSSPVPAPLLLQCLFIYAIRLQHTCGKVCLRFQAQQACSTASVGSSLA